MYRNVIVGVDGEQGGRDAAALAALLASPGAHLTLIHVRLTVSMPSPAMSSELDLASDSSLRSMLKQEIGCCREDAEVMRVKASSVGSGLEAATEHLDPDLIVVGCSRRHGISRVLAGDDATSVMHETPVTVAIAPHSYGQGSGPLSRIGVACDASPQSEVAMAHAGLLASEKHATVAPCHVVEPHFPLVGWGMIAAPVDDPSAALQAARKRLPEVDGVEVEHRYGLVGDELIAFSRNVDLLVTGSRHRGPMRRFAAGSTSDYLSRRVDVPLLVSPSSDPIAVERWQTQRRAAAV